MFLIIRIINTIDKKVVVLLNADWHIKVQPVIIHNRWYNKVYSCDKKCVPLAIAEEIERRKANNVLNKYEKRIPVHPLATTVSNSNTNEIKETKTKTEPILTCPQCHKEMAEDWELCPYCGYNPKEEEKKKQEKDNLRFAPPQYRNVPNS